MFRLHLASTRMGRSALIWAAAALMVLGAPVGLSVAAETHKGNQSSARPTGEPYEGETRRVPDSRNDALGASPTGSGPQPTGHGEVVSSTWSTLLVKSHPRISDPTVPALRIAVRLARPTSTVKDAAVRVAARVVVSNDRDSAQSSAALTSVYRVLTTIDAAASSVSGQRLVGGPVRVQRLQRGEWVGVSAQGARASWDRRGALVWLTVPQARLADAVQVTTGALRTAVRLVDHQAHDRSPRTSLNLPVNR